MNKLIAKRQKDVLEWKCGSSTLEPPRKYSSSPGYGELIPVPRDYIKGDMYGQHAAQIPYNDPLSLLRHPLAIELGIQKHQLAITEQNAHEIQKLFNGPGNGLEMINP